MITLSHIDTCSPCYFAGSSAKHFQVPVYKDMTKSEFIGAIEHELFIDGYINNDNDDSLAEYIYKHQKETKQAIADFIKVKNDSAKMFNYLEDCDDEYCDSVYVYIAIDL